MSKRVIDTLSAVTLQNQDPSDGPFSSARIRAPNKSLHGGLRQKKAWPGWGDEFDLGGGQRNVSELANTRDDLHRRGRTLLVTDSSPKLRGFMRFLRVMRCGKPRELKGLG